MALTQKEISARCYRRKRDNGLCPRCGKLIDRRGFYCSECLEKTNAYHRESKQFYREHHICTACGKERVFGNEKTCPECRQKANSRKESITEEQKKRYGEQAKKHQKSLYAERKEKGICTRCGKRKAAPNRAKCGICLAKDAESSRKSWIARSERKSYGICYICGNALDREGGTCKKCAEMLANNLHAEGNKQWM